MAFLKEKKIPTVIITSENNLAFKEFADYFLTVPSGEQTHVKVATFVSQVSFEYLLDSLYALVYATDYTKNLVNLKDKEAVMDRYF